MKILASIVLIVLCVGCAETFPPQQRTSAANQSEQFPESKGAGAYNITVPMPLAGGRVDDVGWKRGWSTDATGGPWRVGMPEGRWMVWQDYEVLVYIAKAVGTRLQCNFIMCEFDRSNICAEYPTTTWQGSNWDNSQLVSDDDFRIMNYVKDNAAYIEFSLHGVGHEHWDPVTGERTRAEFAKADGTTWPYEVVKGHLECYKRLIDQYGISFPKNYVPTASYYYYNPDDPNDHGGLLSSYGVKTCNAGEDTYITDHGVMVLPRISVAVPWNAVGMAPEQITSACIIVNHWANMVEKDPADNHKAGDKWIQWCEKIKALPDRYIPKNTAQLYSQYLYKKYTFFNTSFDKNQVRINNKRMPDEVYKYDLLGNLVLKVPLENGRHISSAQFSGGNIACYYEDKGFGYIILPKLEKSYYTLTFSTGPYEMPNYAINDGTFNVLKFTLSDKNATVSLQMYGTGDVKVKLDAFKPTGAESNSKNLVINSWNWDQQTRTFIAKVTATDVQGVVSDLIITSD